MIKVINILFLIILIYIGNINSFIIKDIRPQTIASNKQLVGYGGQCSFSYSIYCEPSNLSESCDPLKIYTNSENLVINSLSSNNGTVFIYYYNIKSPVGSFRINFNTILNINFECIDYDLNKVEFKLVGDGYFFYPVQEYQSLVVFGVYEMLGLDPTIDSHTVSFQNIEPSNDEQSILLSNIPNSNKFLFQTGLLRNTSNFLNPTVFIHKLTSTEREFGLEPIFKDTFDNIYDIKLFPDEVYLSNLELIGNGEGPVIQFTSNNTIYKSLFLSYLSTGAQYYPISGTNTSTTFLLSAFRGEYGYSTLTNIYYIKGGSVEKSSISFETTLQFSFDRLPSIVNTYQSPLESDGRVPIVTFGFQDSKIFGFQNFEISTGIFNYISTVPFGFAIGDPTLGYTFRFDSLIKQYYFQPPFFNFKSFSNEYSFQLSNLNLSIVYDLAKSPSVYNVEIIHLEKESYLYRLYVSSPYDLYYILVGSRIYYSKCTLVSGDLKYGVYEIVAPIILDTIFSIYDTYGVSYSLISSAVLSFYPLNIYINPIFVPNFDITSIQNVQFLYNDIDVKNFRHYNVLYFNIGDSFSKYISITMIPYDTILNPRALDSSDKYFFSTYNESLQLFQIEFYVEANSPIGDYQFALKTFNSQIYSNVLDTKLRIKNSLIDLQGPIFKEIKKSNVFIDEVNSIAEIGWSITIQDSINGFSYGYATIRAEIDQSIYNISITSDQVKSDGTVYLGEYDFLFNISYPCKSQNYVITDIELFDMRGRSSYFSIFPTNPYYSGVLNPFLLFLNDSSINKIPVSCADYSASSNDISPPVLNQFQISTTTIDVSKTVREIGFNVSALDPQSGLKNDQDLIIYLSSTNNRIIQCPLKFYKLIGTESFYSGSIQLPLGFGYPDGIIIQLFNLINNNGFYSGFSSIDLKENGKSYYIETTFETNEPTITEYLRIDERGGDLWLIGRGFDNSTQAYITFNGNPMSTIFNGELVSSTTLKVSNVNATDKPYKVYVKTSMFTSNEILVKPFILGYNDRPPSSYTPTSTPSQTPAPTNKPQKCLGSPICGGPSNGKCISNQGCVCFSPWVGVDCLSQIIIIDQPKINSSTPSTEIIIPGNENNGSDENTIPISYRSLVSLVLIREIDINGNELYKKAFDKWNVEKIDNSTFVYNTNLIIDNQKGTSKTTNFKVTLKWFSNESTITFANEELVMNPSTMKYTIEIDSFPFSSQLNILELVMSAYFESNSTNGNVCSVKEFGETTSGDNSNYIKVQIDNHSLYGRFIRRGIIDSTIRTITNVQLDRDMKPITSTKQLQSFIGVQIPNFKQNVIIDPDFSVILDSYSASSKSSSICSSSNSKLSVPKIVGIVIGGVAFIAGVVVAISYHLYKKKKNAKFLENINQKMKQMDKL